MRDERGHTQPAFWAAFRYYGARSEPLTICGCD